MLLLSASHCHRLGLTYSIVMYIFFYLLDGEDFIAFDREFVVLPGATELIIPISIVDDVFPEMSEQFEVLLHTSPGVFIDSPSRVVVTILNDDPNLPSEFCYF